MGLNFDDYLGFKPKTTPAQIYATLCTIHLNSTPALHSCLIHKVSLHSPLTLTLLIHVKGLCIVLENYVITFFPV